MTPESRASGPQVPRATTQLTRELAVAAAAARAAGALVAGYFARGVAVERKAGDEPVTCADREAQVLILAALRATFPDDGVLAEEQPRHDEWAGRRRVWVVDPLDGTKDFVAGRPGFAVMVGLLEEGRPVLGVVYDPLRAVLYRAARGAGAALEQAGAPATPLAVSTRDELAALRLVASRSHRSPAIDRVKAATGITDEENVGSVGLKVGLIARGERDLYINPEGHSSLWDICAPQVILEEAGGVVSDIHGDEIDYDPRQLKLRHGILASNGACHAAVLRALAPIFPRG